MIYVHVPFCRSFCAYCGFYSEVAPKCRRTEDMLKQNALFEGYALALEAEIKTRYKEIERVFASSSDVNTLYIGGGTPSVLPLHVFERIVRALGRPEYREFTVEVNPEDIVERGVEYVRGLLEVGVNRISMGVQSFDDRILKWMNRRHTASQAVQAYHILEEAGVRNISIDLIFGLPQMTGELWHSTLDKALAISSCGIPPTHISAYQLSIEEGSMLEKMVAKGMWSEASDDKCLRQYEVLCERLGAAGYHHYEISNFAQPGHEAEHNSAYWKHVPYVGLGPGAHSFMEQVSHDGALLKVRQWNAESLERYVDAGRSGDFHRLQESEVLDEEQLLLEKVMLGLRTSSGIEEQLLRGFCGEETVDTALASGSLESCGAGFLRIPESGFFVSDNIVLDLVGRSNN